MKTETGQFKLNMPTDLLDMIKGIAERECRSVTAQMNLMLRRQVETEVSEKK